MAALMFENLPFLASIAEGATPEACRVWLRVATDHFITREMHTRDDLDRFTRAITKLLDQVDGATRLMIAQKLSACWTTPEAVLEHIVRLDGPAANHVLQHARGLPIAALSQAAQGSSAKAILIALRVDLNRQTVMLLAQRHDAPVLEALASNQAAPLDAETFSVLAEHGGKNKKVAAALLARAPMGREHAALFLHADSAQRRAILLDAARADLGRVNSPIAPALDAESLAQLEHLAIARQIDLFELGVSEALGCDLPIAEAIVRDRSGEPLALALAALGAPDDMALRILVASDIHYGVEASRVAALSRLRDAMSMAAAQRVVAAITGKHSTKRTSYRSVFDATANAAPGRAQAAALSPAVLRRRKAFELSETYRAQRA